MGNPDGLAALPMNTYWVVPGRFAAGEYPGALSRREAAYKLRMLLNAGVGRFIDLTESNEGLLPYAETGADEAKQRGTTFEHIRHSVVDLHVPDSPLKTAAILDDIDEAMADGKAVYVHCWGGVGRTGDEALDQIATWWKGDLVEGNGEGASPTAFTRDAAAARVRAQLERTRLGGAE